MISFHRLLLCAACIGFFAYGDRARAQEFVPLGMADCSQEIAQFCPAVPRGTGKVIKCLHDIPTLSAECKAAVRPSDGAGGDLSITVSISGIKSKAGYIFVTLSDDRDKFPAGRRMVIAPANGATLVVTFKHLRPNLYVVTAFHDENNNSKFDAGFTGVEGFAASNEVVGPPSFDKSAVKVARDTSLTLAMHYF